MTRYLSLLFLPALVFADKNEDLLAAARQGNLESVQALLKDGAEIESKTAYGQTPLYLAVMQGHTQVAALLLEKGAKTDIRDTFYKFGMADMALQRKHFETVRVLLQKDPTLHERNFRGLVMFADKPTLEAAYSGGKAKQATLDAALNVALEMKREEAVQVLTAAGAKAPEPPMAIDPKILASYAGAFKSEQIPLQLTFSVRDGKLIGQLTGQPEFAPRPKSPTAFSLASVGAEFEFTTPDSVTLRQGGATLVFNKVK